MGQSNPANGPCRIGYFDLAMVADRGGGHRRGACSGRDSFCWVVRLAWDTQRSDCVSGRVGWLLGAEPLFELAYLWQAHEAGELFEGGYVWHSGGWGAVGAQHVEQ